jgi:hypothetical protein
MLLTSVVKTMANTTQPVDNDAMPAEVNDCTGISISNDNVSMANSKISDTIALFGSCLKDNILARLMDTPTNISPVSAAAALAVATKKLFHCASV